LKWRNMKIGSKYGVALAITIVMFAVASGFVTMSLFEFKNTVNDIEIAAERSIALTQMESLFRAKEIIIMDAIKQYRMRLVDDYKAVENKFSEVYTEIEPKMNTEDLVFLMSQINKNNKGMDDVFINEIVPNLEQEKMEEVSAGIIKITSFRNASILLIERAKLHADNERQKEVEYAYASIERSIQVMIMAIIAVIILGSIIVYLISRRISRNLNAVVVVANKISEGELTVDDIKYYGKDEVGQLSSSMNKMLSYLRSMIKEISESSHKVDEDSDTLKKIASEVQESSEQIAATMEEMASGAEEQANSATEIASSIYSLTELTRKAIINKEALENSSRDIIVVAKEGTVQMESSIGTMSHINEILKDSVDKNKKLDENSKKVSVLVKIINSIADQTNLLALNAAIEAARAGEAGRGFAVVADEIRKLAEQVGKSVNEITDIVMGIQSEAKSMTEALEKGYYIVEEGTHKIKATGEIFAKINTEIDVMVERIKNVSKNLDEISLNSNKINLAGDQIAAISQENSAGIEQTVASVEQQNNSMEIISQNTNSLASSAEALKQLVSQFKI